MNLPPIPVDGALVQPGALPDPTLGDENVSSGLLVLDERLEHVTSNPRLRELLGLPDHLFDAAPVTLESLLRFLAQRGDFGAGDPEHFVADYLSLARARTAVRRERSLPGGRILEECVICMGNGWQALVYRDVTEERAVHTRLRASEERLELALQASGLGLWEYTPQNDSVYLSASLQQMLGYAPTARTVRSAELMNLVLDDAALQQFRDGLVSLLKGSSRQLCFEHEVDKATGARIWLQTDAQVVARDDAGWALRVVGTAKNITERKRQEEALVAAARAAESASRAKAEFLATMSHEIRTPLNGVIGLARVLEQSVLPAREADYVRQINSCATSLLGMVNDVLDFSKIEAGQMVLEPSECDLRALIEETADVFADHARAKALDFRVDVGPEVPRWVTVDANRLRQILLNLLGNALKFTPSGGFHLSATTASLAHHRSLQISVADTGIGISVVDQTKLFKRFSQVDASTTRRFQGSGLGLAISRDLAQLMGGDIRVSSAPGAGSIFTLEIPLVEADTDGCRRSGETDQSDSGAHTDEADYLIEPILLVEDNPINQLVAVALLDKLGFVDLTTAVNGQEAVQLCAGRSFSLVLMDCQMPVMDGFEATRQLRAGGFDRPIVALTAGAVSDDRERCLASGIDDYLAKPIDVALLSKTMKFWLARGRAGPQRPPR